MFLQKIRKNVGKIVSLIRYEKVLKNKYNGKHMLIIKPNAISKQKQYLN
jgi:hypothetical protein